MAVIGGVNNKQHITTDHNTTLHDITHNTVRHNTQRSHIIPPHNTTQHNIKDKHCESPVAGYTVEEEASLRRVPGKGGKGPTAWS